MNPAVLEAANCLRDDPSFRLITSLEEQRAEARLILAAVKGGTPDLADDVILLALEGDDTEADVKSIEVDKADYANGAWIKRRLQITVPKKNPVGRPPKAIAAQTVAFEDLTLDKIGLNDIPPEPIDTRTKLRREREKRSRDHRMRVVKERAERAAKRWAPRPRAGIIETKRELLTMIKASLGNSQSALATTLGVSRSTIDAVLGGRLEWHPTKDQMKHLKGLLAQQHDLITETLVFIDQIEGKVENA